MTAGELREKFFEILDRVGSVSVAAREAGVKRGTAFGWARGAGHHSVCPSRPHPRRGEYELLCRQGVVRRRAAEQVGINVRTAKDWDRGVRKTRGRRLYPDGRRVDYNSGVSTEVMVAPSLMALDKQLHARFLTLMQRETIAEMRRAGQSLHAIGRALGRPASTIKREIDHHGGADGVYRAYAAHRAWALPQYLTSICEHGLGPNTASCCGTGRCATSWSMGWANGGRRSKSATLWSGSTPTSGTCG